jgi:hypothetical protein
MWHREFSQSSIFPEKLQPRHVQGTCSLAMLRLLYSFK